MTMPQGTSHRRKTTQRPVSIGGVDTVVGDCAPIGLPQARPCP